MNCYYEINCLSHNDTITQLKGNVKMPELDSITIHGFKSIADVEDLKLAPINVVIGPNGSGKSNLVGVFSFLHAIRDGRLQDYVAKAGGADKILHFGSKVTDSIKLCISFQDGVNKYGIELGLSQSDQLYVYSEWSSYWNKLRYPKGPPYKEPLISQGLEAGISNPQLMRATTAGYVRAHLDRWRLYHFHDTSNNSPMKKTADLYDNRFLRPDGSNLAAFLYYLKQRHEESYGLIRKTIQRVTPFFDDFLLEPSKLNPDTIRLEWRHKSSDTYFDAASFSDGTLRFISLTTLFLQPISYRPSVILVDEPELGLHPHAITMLAHLIKQASDHTQVIVATQSPLLLDHFQPEDVLVADRVSGKTKFTRLNSTNLSTWLEDYSLGQLWEKNEFGGRPRNE